MYPTEMSREQRLFLVNLNNRLSEIEKHLKKEALEIIDTLNNRVDDDTDWIHDFDLECTLEFYLREDDPDYSRVKDHILAKFTIGISLMINSDRYLPGSDKNWNSRSVTDMDNQAQLEHHCCLYRQLYDRTQIHWKDMLRIGSAWVHINITLHHHLKLS